MIDISKLDPTIKLDIRYATKNNFTNTAVYPANASSVAYLQKPVANDLLEVNKELKQHGYGLIIYDAYRPLSVTEKFYQMTPDNEKHFVANPAEGSVHNRGAAVDCGLYDLSTGQPADMPSEFDQPTNKATDASKLLKDIMEKHNFISFTPDETGLTEWWHYDHKTSSNYPIMDKTFEMLAIAAMDFDVFSLIIIVLATLLIIVLIDMIRNYITCENVM